MNLTSNKSISCTVSSCEHHNRSDNACLLNSIQVGRCGPTTSSSACTECDSFQLKKTIGQ